MRGSAAFVLIFALAACGQRASQTQEVPSNASGATAESSLSQSRAVQGSSERQQLKLWQSVGLMIETDEQEAERLVTRVLAAHNVVASDENVKNMVGAMLIFRDQDSVGPKQVLDCMDSGVRSPTGLSWQDTMALCVTELAA